MSGQPVHSTYFGSPVESMSGPSKTHPVQPDFCVHGGPVGYCPRVQIKTSIRISVNNFTVSQEIDPSTVNFKDFRIVPQ